MAVRVHAQEPYAIPKSDYAIPKSGGTGTGGGGSGAVTDGDYGDITVSGTGTVFTLDLTFAPTAAEYVLCAAHAGTSAEVVAGTGVCTWLATPTSANLASAITNETGSGALVFATSPTFVTPILGTPTSGTATNITGLPPAGVTFALTNQVLCRDTTGGGAGEECATSAILDMRTTTRGSILYRGAANWDGLAPGTSGHVLTSNGSGADPSYQAVPGSGFTDASPPFRYDDFFGARSSGTSSCADYSGWTVSNSGTVAGNTNFTATPDVNHPGNCDFTTGTDTTGRSAMYLQTLGMLGNGAEVKLFETQINIGALSTTAQTYTFRNGFGDSASADMTDGAYFSYTNDDGNATPNWKINVADATTRTQADCGVAAATGWVTLKVTLSSGSGANFYVNGAECSNSPLTGANVPDSDNYFTPFAFQIIKTTGTTGLTVIPDYVHYSFTGLTR